MKRAFAHIGFSFAVALLVAELLSIKLLILVTIGLAVLFAASLVIDRYRQAVSVPLCFGSALLACLLLLFVMQSVVAPQLALDGQNADVLLYITDAGRRNSDGTYSYSAVARDVMLSGAPQNIHIYLKSGSMLRVDGYRLISANVDFHAISDNAVASYGHWGDGEFLSARIRHYHITDYYCASPMRHIYNIRRAMTDDIMHTLPGDRGALTVAMLTGDRSHMSDDLLNDFRMAGATHIMAVSGLHLTAVCGMALAIMRRLRISKRVQGVTAIGVALFYSALAGFSWSVVRAGIMLIVLSLGNVITRRADSLNSLGLAVFIICLHPFAVYDVSALLSVLAVLSLVVLYPLVGRHLTKITDLDTDKRSVTDLLRNAVIDVGAGVYVSLCVMLFTLPVMCIFFGYCSVAGVVANVVIVPITAVMMPLSLMTYLFSPIGFAYIGSLLSGIIGLLSDIIIRVVSGLASFSGATVHTGTMLAVTLAGVMVVAAMSFIISRRMTSVAAIMCSVVMVVSLFVGTVCLRSPANVYVSSNGAVVISDSDRVVVSGVSSRSSYYDVLDYLRCRHMTIDYIIIDGGSAYSIALMDVIPTDTVLMSDFDDSVLACGRHRDIYVTDSYDVRLCDDMTLHYDRGRYNVSMLGITVGTSSGSDINISGDYVVDHNGRAAVSDGDLIYDIYNGGTYGAGRMKEWQK